MRRLGPIAIVLLLATASGACTSASLPQLPAGTAPLETGAVGSAQPAATLGEIAIIAPGTPTQTYALVAGGAMRCWFGAGGPLKPTHVFHAEAAPPAHGGVAEIVLHERDVSLRDQRGARAFRVSFTDIAGGARVGITSIKVAAPLSELMARDVVDWAGGGTGCQARALSPPPPPQPAAPAQKSAKPKGSRGSGQ
jgi:hypothetical protein